MPRPNTTIETVTSLQDIEQTRIQVPQEAVELYGKSSQDTDQNVNLAKITAARNASKVTTWNTCGACCWLNRFWQVCFFARMTVQRSTGKQKATLRTSSLHKSIKSCRTSFFQTHPRLRNVILQDLADTPTQNQDN